MFYEVLARKCLIVRCSIYVFAALMSQKQIVVRCAIWDHLYNLKNVKNTPRGVLIIRENTGHWKPVFSHILCSSTLLLKVCNGSTRIILLLFEVLATPFQSFLAFWDHLLFQNTDAITIALKAANLLLKFKLIENTHLRIKGFYLNTYELNFWEKTKKMLFFLSRVHYSELQI